MRPQDFYWALVKAYPHSPRREELEWARIESRGNLDWPEWRQLLRRHLSAYPNGRHATDARLTLARIHDNVWQILAKEPAYRSLVPNAPKSEQAVAVLAESHRSSALRLYGEVLPRLSDDRAGSVRDRVEQLRRHEPQHEWTVLTD